jgi:hypothetical protein
MAKWPIGENFTADSKTSFSIGLTPEWQQVVISLDEVVQVNTLIYFVELATTQITTRKNEWKVHALATVKDGGEKGHFRRVGFSTWNQDFWTDLQASNRQMEGENKEADLKLRKMEITIA